MITIDSIRNFIKENQVEIQLKEEKGCLFRDILFNFLQLS